jgi:hypothetical protein
MGADPNLSTLGRMELPMWGGATTRQQLQQSITLLQVLNEVPELPKENNLGSNVDTTHRLSVSREIENFKQPGIPFSYFGSCPTNYGCVH